MHQTHETNPKTNKLTLVKHKDTFKNLILNRSLVRTVHINVYDCALLCYTIQHRTVLIIFLLVLRTIIIGQNVV